MQDSLDGRLISKLDHLEARRKRLTRPFYGTGAKEGDLWKTEDYFEKTGGAELRRAAREIF